MWTPWIGQNFDRRRLLVLGESCYLLEGKDGELYQPDNDHPRQFVTSAIEYEKYRYRFYTTIARALAGEVDLSDADWSTAWNDVAHTNYVPTVVHGRGRDRPTAEQWQKARADWPNLLESLRPMNVVVLGLSMWEQMPETVERFDRFNHDYELADGTRVKCLAVKHPSAGLSWMSLREAIVELEAR